MLHRIIEQPSSWRLFILTLLLSPLANAWAPTKHYVPLMKPVGSSDRTSANERCSRLSRSSIFMSTEVDQVYYSPASFTDRLGSSEEMEMQAATMKYGMGGGSGGQKITLTRWLSAKVQDFPELRDMESLHLSIQMACKTISNLIHSSSGIGPDPVSDSSNPRDNSMKRLDQISKTILQNALRFTGRLRVVEAPRNENTDEEGPASHQPGVTIAYALDQYGKEGRKTRGVDEKWGKARRLAACFDPLDGSGNADAAICTGTVFGVFDADAAFKGGESPDLTDEASLARAVLQPGNKLLAAGYCLYSSTTILVFSLGNKTYGFTLDPTINEFVLTHPDMRIPKRGNIYSCNEANSEGWDDNFKQYVKALKTGKGETGQRYTQRYIGSLVGDVHRTLTYGGIFGYPADNELHPNGNLQLVYKSAPMAYIIEHAGGKSSNGEVGLLSVAPKSVHERSPCFMGSPEDMDELMSYIGKQNKN